MVKNDWVKLQADFLAAHKETGVTVVDWCEQNGLNYASARRHIKTSIVKGKIKQKNKPVSKEIALSRRSGKISHGGYSKYFNVDITKLVTDGDLTDELDLCRSRIHLVICAIEEIQVRLDQKPRVDADVAASLFESLFKADIALDRNIARVESITKTLSAIRIDVLNESKIVADTIRSNETTKATVINAKKSIKQTELLELQIKQAEKLVGGTSKIDDYIDSITNSKLDSVVG